MNDLTDYEACLQVKKLRFPKENFEVYPKLQVLNESPVSGEWWG